MPIKTRIDMLATGVKTPLGIRVSGPDLLTLQHITTRIEKLLEALPGTQSVYAERVAAGRYVTIDIDRHRAASWGLNIADVHDIIDYTVGGAVVTNTLEGRERYSVNLRYPSSWRDSVKTLEQLPFVTPQGVQLALGDVANIRIDDGPSVIKSEQGRPSSWVLIDLNRSDLAGYVAAAQDLIEQELTLPPGYSVQWTGQYEAMQRANARLRLAVPITIALVATLLYAHFRRWRDVAVILMSLPLAIAGAFWLLWLLNYSLSVAVWVGIIAVVGVSTEMAVLMMVYLNRASREREVTGVSSLLELLCDAAVLRLRPVLMTVATLVVALLPVLLGAGTGTDVMQRIVAPMVGGMVSAFLLAMFVVPAAYLVLSKPPAIKDSY
jgi:Cu(I)/Ag(I) efflux system membrane protein CusA/SilA